MPMTFQSSTISNWSRVSIIWMGEGREPSPSGATSAMPMKWVPMSIPEADTQPPETR